ncbi:MAG: septal ring lytic transglycosylase RlpA family protein, partial [bacterium]|nr:septal ring lytic transglycosylase RlpA family protein [bacterium]
QSSCPAPRVSSTPSLFLFVLIFCLLTLQTACVSRPRYRTHPPPEQPRTQTETEKPNAKNPNQTPAPPVSTKGAYQIGLSSYYAHKFHGRPTASGEIFDMNGLSAAHRELPLGTVIRVTHMGNGRSIELKVNDRGPFVEGRILDLSLGAARRLDMVEAGVAKVKIEIIKAVE